MDRRTFTNTVGLGALLGSAGVQALSVSERNGNESVEFQTVYKSKRLEPMVGTTFQCENHAGQFQMVELKRELDQNQFHLLFRNSGSDEDLAEKIYLLSEQQTVDDGAGG